MNAAVIVLLFLGLLFYCGGAVGILRFPDFYARLHPAGKLDTAGLVMTMGGAALFASSEFTLDAVITALKIVLIVVFVFITSPTATHAMVDAGARAGLKPWVKRQAAAHDLAD